MKPSVEHIGTQVSWPKRVRRWLIELFGSDYVRLLERDLLQARLEKAQAQSEAKVMQERLLEVMAATKGIPWRPLAIEKADKPTSKPVQSTRWAQIQAEAIAENARLEVEDEKSKPAAQEN